MTSLRRFEPALIDFYTDIQSSIVTDSLSRLGLGSWMDDIRPLNLSWRLSGRVRTVTFAPRSGVRQSSHSIYSVCDELEPGDVMVIATGATRGWLLGENTAHYCQNRGLKGIVTDGRVRDATELRTIPFPVFSRGTTARPFHAEVELVGFDQPVSCGGAFVRSGDLIVGDEDGIVVVPQEAVEAVVPEAQELMALEIEQEEAIKARAPLAVVQDISRRKKIRRGPPLDLKPAR